MRVLYVVLDGAPDSLSSPKRALEEAEKPNIDSIARRALCGMVYTIKPGVAPQSDYATLSLLGYNPDEYYPGRGALEALGAGIRLRPGDIALRANFATVDPESMRIVDRRVGRSLTTREAKMLGRSVDGLRLDGGDGVAFFAPTIGHRGVLVLSHSKVALSGEISNTDPAYERRGRFSVALEKFEPYVAESRPLTDSEGARKAASLLNEFTRKAIEVLDKHPVNLDRARRGLLKANAILSRDAGGMPEKKPPGFEERFGLRGASIVEMVVEKGIASYVGIEDISVEVEGKDRARVYREEAEKAVEGLEAFDLVYVHLKGPDEPGHDGDLDGKIRAIEEIDKSFFGRLLDLASSFEDLSIIVTSDHATPWDRAAHSDDPVPLMVSGPGIKGRDVNTFSEKQCYTGRLGIIVGAYNILPKIIKLLEG